MRNQRTSRCDAGNKMSVKARLDLSRTDGFEYGGQCYIYTAPTGAHVFELRHRFGIGWLVKCEALGIDEVIPSEISHKEIQRRLNDLAKLVSSSAPKTFDGDFDQLAQMVKVVIAKKQQWAAGEIVTVIETSDGGEFYLRNSGGRIELNFIKRGSDIITLYGGVAVFDFVIQGWAITKHLGLTSVSKMVPTYWSNWVNAVSKI